MNISRFLLTTCALVLATSTSVTAQENEEGKQKLLADFRQEMMSEQGKTGVPADLSTAESTCSNATSTITQCRRVIRESKNAYASLVKTTQENADSQPSVIYQNPNYGKTRPGTRPPGKPVQLPVRPRPRPR